VGGDREAKATTAEEAPMEPSELDLHVSQANTPTPAPFVRTTSSTQPLPDGLPRPGQCKRPRKAITEEESKATTAEEAPTSEGAAVGAEFEAEGATNTHTEDLRGKLDKLLWKIKKLFEPLNKELSLKESPASKDPWCGSVINTANPVFDEAAKMLEQHKPEGERDNDLYWTLDPDLTNDQLVHKRVEFRQMYDQLAKEVTTFDLSYEKIGVPLGVECMRGLGSASLLVTALSIPPAEPAPPEDAEGVTLDEWQEFNVGLSRSEASHYEEQFTADASARVRFEGAVAEGAKGGAPTTKRQKRGLTPDGDGMVSVLGAKLHCVRWTVLGAGCEGGIPSKT
jgi:hypothetical protein